MPAFREDTAEGSCAMKRPRVIAALVAMLGTSVCFASPDQEAIEAEAKRIVKTLVGEVKPMLQGYIKARGPAGAVKGCAADAPAIADRISEDTGWTVGRVSLQPRNMDRGVPDAWETATLQQLEKRRREGADVSELNHGEWVEGRYRYMQAQVVEGVCLNCHGEKLDPEVQSTIAEYYPEDTATGFSLGDIRGAVTLESPPGD